MSNTPRRTSRATSRPGGGRRLRLAALVCLMVAAPIAAVSWLGGRSMRYEQERLRLRLAEAALSALEGVASAVRERVDGDAREITALLDALPEGTVELRRVGRSHRLVRQVFLLEPGGSLRYPAEAGELSSRELEFLERTRAVWEQGFLSGPPEEAGEAGRGVWQSWVWGSGTSFLYWRREADGSVRGVEVEASALIADVIATLPETPVVPAAASAGVPGSPSLRVTLAGADGELLYQWGSYEPGGAEPPLGSRRLEAPLAGWSLSYYAPDDGSGGGSAFAVAASVAALALLLAGAGVYLWRETSREAREALTRVSFVNQVSHELKSPLTNIRLYAELMEERLEAGSGRIAERDRKELGARLAVIVDESRRLSRLVHNVLSIARRDRGTLEVRRSPGVVDEIIRSVLEDFAPSLEEKGVKVELDCAAGSRAWVDADALEQILANLIGNVEKYASGGAYLGIRSRREGEVTTIRLRDKGPGIPASQRERVFEPFYRVSNRLSDGVAGTGIGLTIARELARLHGGEVELAAAQGQGAELVVTLLTPGCEEEP